MLAASRLWTMLANIRVTERLSTMPRISKTCLQPGTMMSKGTKISYLSFWKLLDFEKMRNILPDVSSIRYMLKVNNLLSKNDSAL